MPDTGTILNNRLTLDPVAEEFLATLTDTAYQVALQHGVTGNFLEVQLDLWAALRDVVASHERGQPRPRVAVN